MRLVVLDTRPDASGLESRMPGGWTSQNGMTCLNSTRVQEFYARGGANTHLSNAQITCTLIITKDDDAW